MQVGFQTSRVVHFIRRPLGTRSPREENDPFTVLGTELRTTESMYFLSKKYKN